MQLLQQRQEEETKRLAEKKFAAAKAESNASADSNSSAAASSTAKDKKLQLDFVDGGNHYCRLCCTVSESIDAFCKHLHDKKHRKVRSLFIQFLADRKCFCRDLTSLFSFSAV